MEKTNERLGLSEWYMLFNGAVPTSANFNNELIFFFHHNDGVYYKLEWDVQLLKCCLRCSVCWGITTAEVILILSGKAKLQVSVCISVCMYICVCVYMRIYIVCMCLYVYGNIRNYEQKELAWDFLCNSSFQSCWPVLWNSILNIDPLFSLKIFFKTCKL